MSFQFSNILKTKTPIWDVSNTVNRDIDIAKQKEKIKFLKGKLNQSHMTHNEEKSRFNYDHILSQNRLLNQRCIIYEAKILQLANDNNRLNHLVDQYESAIQTSKQKLVQLSQMNCSIIEKIETAYSNQRMQRQQQINSECNNKMPLHLNYNTMNNHSLNNNNINSNQIEKDNLNSLIEEMKAMRLQIKNIEKRLIEEIQCNNKDDTNIKDKDKGKERLMTDINQSHDTYNDLLTMKTIINNYDNKSTFYNDIYHCNIQRMNKVINKKDKQINDLKQSRNVCNNKLPLTYSLY